MHTKVDIKRNDQVKVISGRDKGKQGRVLRVFPADAKVLVEHVMMVKKNVRPGPAEEREGRNRRAGIADRHFERDGGLSELRPVAGRTQDGRQQACPGLPPL